jgi:hypothetical protein
MKEDRIIASSALLFLLSLPSAHGLTASGSDASAEDQQRIVITRSDTVGSDFTRRQGEVTTAGYR